MKAKELLPVENAESVEHGLNSVLEHIKNVITRNDKPVLVLSDFDHTLCGQFIFDPVSNDHQPELSPALVDQAQLLNLIIATGRRADNPALPHLWQSGLIPVTQSIIAENGGVLLSKTENDLNVEVLSEDEVALSPETMIDCIQQAQLILPSNHNLVFKPGRTFLVVRVQDELGNTPPEHQKWLAKKLRGIEAFSSLQVVDTRASVTIQARHVNKGAAFNQLLARKGLNRDGLFVVGMGDGENDAEIFSQADLRLGYSQVVKKLVDIVIPGGAQSAPAVLQVINQSLGV